MWNEIDFDGYDDNYYDYDDNDEIIIYLIYTSVYVYMFTYMYTHINV
jgi:hypothetical protein